VNTYKGSVVETLIENRVIRFFVANQNDSIQQYHFKGEFYEREELALMSRYWRPDRVYADIGTNVGNHALFVSKFLDCSKIIVFEPNPPALAVLRLNLLLNHCDRVDTRYLGLALGAEEGLASLCPDPKHPDNLGGTSAVLAPNGDTVVIPGDEVLRGESVGFLKIDIEGMEMEVLKGLEKTISRWRPNIFIEVRHPYKPAFQDWMRRHFYEVAGTYDRYTGMSNFMIVPVSAAAR
jgi:FkbM family methyltransferase